LQIFSEKCLLSHKLFVFLLTINKSTKDNESSSFSQHVAGGHEHHMSDDAGSKL
jgi:hypothetical protein